MVEDREVSDESPKRYSLDEIDRMRHAIATGGFFDNGSYKESDRTVEVEARLRTYMQNGTSPAELEEWSVRKQQEWWDREQAEQEARRRWAATAAK